MPTTYEGWRLEVRVAQVLNTLTGSTITGSAKLEGVTKVTTEYSNSLSPTKNVGDRTVYAYLPGTINISGVIERFYSGAGAYTLIRGTGGSGSLGFTGGVCVYPNSAVSGQPFELFGNVSFGDFRTQSRPGSALKIETYDFVACRHFTGSLP